jgi:hypothetical protein
MPKAVKPRRREEHIYFENGKFSVTDRNLKTPRRTYRIATIEKIALRRDPFYFALALSIPAMGLIFAFNQYLYDYERIILAGGSALALALTSRLGVLFVESKALAEMAAVASMPTLRQVREAVEAAIDDFHDQSDDAGDD